MEKFVYTTYIAASPLRIWGALFDPQLTSRYWQHDNVSDWKPGSRWEHRGSVDRTLKLAGTVIEATRPRRLVLTWGEPNAGDEERSRVTIALEPYASGSRLKVEHERLTPEAFAGVSEGWPKVLSSLKTLLETGKPLPELWGKKPVASGKR